MKYTVSYMFDRENKNKKSMQYCIQTKKIALHVTNAHISILNVALVQVIRFSLPSQSSALHWTGRTGKYLSFSHYVAVSKN